MCFSILLVPDAVHDNRISKNSRVLETSLIIHTPCALQNNDFSTELTYLGLEIVEQLTTNRPGQQAAGGISFHG